MRSLVTFLMVLISVSAWADDDAFSAISHGKKGDTLAVKPSSLKVDGTLISGLFRYELGDGSQIKLSLAKVRTWDCKAAYGVLSLYNLDGTLIANANAAIGGGDASSVMFEILCRFLRQGKFVHK
jgi:hypothetical protein